MDDKTRMMLVSVGTGFAKKVLMLQAAGLVSHGMMSSNYTEVYVSLGMAVIGAAWSFWNDFGRPIFYAQLEVLKAKSLAQAEKLRQNGIAQVTASQIADKSPTLTPDQVTKTIDTLPPVIQANVR